jgi:tetratricopeptide (TPR) repeat protein
MKLKLPAAAVLLLLMLASMTASGKSVEERKWIRMESQNFTILSTLGKTNTRSLLRHLEAVRSLFHSGQDDRSSSVPTVLYAFDSSSDFRELGLDPMRVAGMFMPGLRENTVIVRDISGMDESDVIVHEYIHYLHSTDGRFPYPMWYREGYAEYVSTSSMERQRFNVGYIDENHHYALGRFKWLPIENIIDSTYFYTLEDRESVYKFYAQSWLLTHYLYNQEGGDQYVIESLSRYAMALHDGATEIEAFEEGFGTTLPELDGALRKYHQKARYKYYWVSADQLIGDFDPAVTRLTEEEISVELAELILGLEFGVGEANADQLAKARQLYETGLSNQETRARGEIGIAYLLESEGDSNAAEEYLISGASLAVDDFYVQLDAAQFWLNRMNSEGYENDELVSQSDPYLKRALAIDRNNAEGLFTAGQYLLASGDTEQAIEILMLAADLAPAVLFLRWTLAELLLESDRLDEALLYANDILLLSHGQSAQVDAARTLIERIELAHESQEEGSN